MFFFKDPQGAWRMFFYKDPQGAWRRRNYFIKREFQARFIAKFLSVIIVGSAMSGYIMYLLVNRDIEYAFYSTHLKLSSTGEMLLPSMLKVNLGVLAVVLAVVALLTLIISHKVVGPLLRLGRDTEKIAKGDFTGDFRLRNRDELKSLARSFEEMNEDLKKRFNELRKQAEEIDAAAEELLRQQAEDGLSRMGKGELTMREHIDRLSENSFIFGRKLSRFETARKAGGKG